MVNNSSSCLGCTAAGFPGWCTGYWCNDEKFLNTPCSANSACNFACQGPRCRYLMFINHNHGYNSEYQKLSLSPNAKDEARAAHAKHVQARKAGIEAAHGPVDTDTTMTDTTPAPGQAAQSSSVVAFLPAPIKIYYAPPKYPGHGNAPLEVTTPAKSRKIVATDSKTEDGAKKTGDNEYPYKASSQVHPWEMFQAGALGVGWKFWWVWRKQDRDRLVLIKEHVKITGSEYVAKRKVFVFDREDCTDPPDNWKHFGKFKNFGDLVKGLALLHDATHLKPDDEVCGDIHVWDDQDNYMGTLNYYRRNWCMSTGRASH